MDTHPALCDLKVLHARTPMRTMLHLQHRHPDVVLLFCCMDGPLANAVVHYEVFGDDARCIAQRFGLPLFRTPDGRALTIVPADADVIVLPFCVNVLGRRTALANPVHEPSPQAEDTSPFRACTTCHRDRSMACMVLNGHTIEPWWMSYDGNRLLCPECAAPVLNAQLLLQYQPQYLSR
jgi:hypothetical protein